MTDWALYSCVIGFNNCKIYNICFTGSYQGVDIASTWNVSIAGYKDTQNVRCAEVTLEPNTFIPRVQMKTMIQITMKIRRS